MNRQLNRNHRLPVLKKTHKFVFRKKERKKEPRLVEILHNICCSPSE